jgi:hypothetical protein
MRRQRRWMSLMEREQAGWEQPHGAVMVTQGRQQSNVVRVGAAVWSGSPTTSGGA